MTANSEAVQLRDALTRYRQHRRFGRFPDDLREQAAAYAGKRIEAGAKPADVAAELGVQPSTVVEWISRKAPTSRVVAPTSPPGPALVPVVVRPEPAVARLARLEVEFHDGTRLHASGIGSSELIDAIQALRRCK